MDRDSLGRGARERLERLLGGGPPQRAREADDALGARPSLASRHLGAIALLAVAIVLVAGWAVLRARAVPVPTAAPTPAPLPSVREPARPSATPSAASDLVVHVVGAVVRPGLVRVPPGARVADALAAAGGLREDADPAGLNLAAPVADGCQVVIGTRADPRGEVRGADAPGSGGGAAASLPPAAGAKVDLNTASQAQLEAIPGVGPVTAGKIIAWRTEHGRFRRVEELQEVDGIGPKTYAQIEKYVRV